MSAQRCSRSLVTLLFGLALSLGGCSGDEASITGGPGDGGVGDGSDVSPVAPDASGGEGKGNCTEVCTTYYSGDAAVPDDAGNYPPPVTPPEHCAPIEPECNGVGMCACERRCGPWGCSERDECHFSCAGM